MNYAFGMGGSQCNADLLDDERGFPRRELASAAQNAAKGLALDVLHRDELDSIRFAQVVNADYVPVRNLVSKDQFLLKALQDSGLPRQFRTNNLECNKPFDFLVAGLIDRSHPADTEHFKDFVAATQHCAWLEFLTELRRLRDLAPSGTALVNC